ncbi:malonyl-CoA-[acp] transacylase [Campylobacter pinnipediorum subsp. caledonicus]|uniref:Malonyl CoA-acyl carrier protein transacylase n=1 Tax=Campylobacter pinnipediorum subsp. caledonicus TaxID=1874362 RepID=A0A1S6U8I0_9BACT|nr:ACP S-malonyltransferase [Campylobacter pinnipediorum]AQW86394.1 malonyl-CoA-[acp] transacylase [Campylobacter pinnipediorum subsp. caledonicus]AQW88046.1 malonyl-CoA-[acp] transacylase [Campylobacter pinnipediorum subsp. caledonicus]OPA71491.1 malonyl CoA-acyl carrier protein transacylase [Campylobacter pinnipediorum subsp. caledonicus]
MSLKYAFIFAGQGSQNVGMGKDFYLNFQQSKDLLYKASQSLDIDFEKLLFAENEELNISEFTQPAIVLNSLMTYEALKTKIELNQEFSLGHSLGEFSALCVNGAFDFIDGIKIVNLRGKFMQEACDGKGAGMMVILGLDDQKVEDICKNALLQGKQVYAANYNCDRQIVVAGIKDDLDALQPTFKEAGAKKTMLLNMSVASHCPILESASDKLYGKLELYIKDSFLPVVSNANANVYTEKTNALGLLKQQLVSPVLYKQSIKNFENNVDCFIEIGSNILKGMNKKITNKPTLSITDVKSMDEVIDFLEGK